MIRFPLAARFVRRHYLASGVVLLLLSLPAALTYRAWRRDVQVAELTTGALSKLQRLKGNAARLEQLARLARVRFLDAATRRKLREAARAVEADTVAALSLLERGLALDPSAPPTRRALLEVLMTRVGLAERLHQDAVARRYRALARSRDPKGQWASRIRGQGAIEVGDGALDARVTLRRFALDRRGVLAPVEPRELGNAPLGPVRLPTGSYLLTLSKPGHVDTSVPVLVRRGRTSRVNPRIFEQKQIPPGYVYVPGGRFIMGDMRDSFGEGPAPWRELDLPGFFMRRKPFTAAEVVAFLKTRPQGKHRDITAVSLLTYPRAQEMVRWEAGRIGRPPGCVRMPSLAQYQKAGRGADGRAYPRSNSRIPGFYSEDESSSEIGVRLVVGLDCKKQP